MMNLQSNPIQSLQILLQTLTKVKLLDLFPTSNQNFYEISHFEASTWVSLESLFKEPQYPSQNTRNSSFALTFTKEETCQSLTKKELQILTVKKPFIFPHFFLGVINLGKSSGKTKTLKETLFPIWYETVTFNVELPEGYNPEIHVSVYDWDRFDPDDFLGRFAVPISTVNDKLPEEPSWYPIYSKDPNVTEGAILASFQL